MNTEDFEAYSEPDALSEIEFGWHFVSDTLRDGRAVPPDGEWLTHQGPLRLCCSGLHGSPLPHHALTYAPGPTLCYCEFGGVQDLQFDKFVAARRKIIKRVDLSDFMNEFTRKLIIAMIDNYDCTPPDIFRRYLVEQTKSLEDAVSCEITKRFNIQRIPMFQKDYFLYRVMRAYIDHAPTHALLNALYTNTEMIKAMGGCGMVPFELWTANIHDRFDTEVAQLFGLDEGGLHDRC